MEYGTRLPHIASKEGHNAQALLADSLSKVDEAVHRFAASAHRGV